MGLDRITSPLLSALVLHPSISRCSTSSMSLSSTSPLPIFTPTLHRQVEHRPKHLHVIPLLSSFAVVNDPSVFFSIPFPCPPRHANLGHPGFRSCHSGAPNPATVRWVEYRATLSNSFYVHYLPSCVPHFIVQLRLFLWLSLWIATRPQPR
jgi:hypothetical protein